MQKAAFYRVKGCLSQRKRLSFAVRKITFCNSLNIKALQALLFKAWQRLSRRAPAQAPTAGVTCRPESGKAHLAAVPGVLLSYLRPQMPAVKACLNER